MTRPSPKIALSAALTVDTLLHGKWAVHILYALVSGPIRLGQLARAIPHSSKKVLTQQLRRLEAAGIVTRVDLSDSVLHVEYALNQDLRESVVALLEHLTRWGNAYLTNDSGVYFPSRKRDFRRAAGERGPESSE